MAEKQSISNQELPYLVYIIIKIKSIIKCKKVFRVVRIGLFRI